MSYSSGNDCLSCKARQKKCDQSRPTCRRCVRAGIECEGYPTQKTFSHRRGEPKTPGKDLSPGLASSLRAGPSAIQIIDLTPPTADLVPISNPQTSNFNPPYQLIAPIPPGTRKPSAISHLPAPYIAVDTTCVPSSPDWSDDVNTSQGDTSSQTSPGSALNISPIGKSKHPHQQAPTLPDEEANATSSDVFSRQLPVLPKTRTMNPSQASLFDALFSLGQPEVEAPRTSDQRGHPSQDSAPGPPSLFDEMFSFGPPEVKADPMPQLFHDSSPALRSPILDTGDASLLPVDNKELDDPADTENVHAKLFSPLKLDRRVQSNAIPFVLQSYAFWMTRFLFEPVRVIPLAREYVVGGYGLGNDARWRLMLVSYVARAVTSSAAYDLGDPPNLAILYTHMCKGFEMVKTRRDPDPEQDREIAMRSLDSVYEFVNMLFKITTLANVITTMQAAAPIFRRACPDPPGELIHLPSLLATINVSLQFFATLDILLSTLTSRPMFFRYDVTFTAHITEAVFNLEEGPGYRWLYGIPDRLLITLARINALLEDYGAYVDAETIKELEAEITSFKSFVSPSVDPTLTVGRLVVQECWRQAAFIYLYMALCGADSQDARVIKAHGKFMKLLKGVKPARNPDAFLIHPMIIFGMATRVSADQDLIRKRMLNLPDCSRPGTVGNDAVRILDDVWSRTSAIGQPAVWPDLRLACLRITGM